MPPPRQDNARTPKPVAPPRPESEKRPLRVLQLCAVDFTVRQFIAPLALHLKSRGCDVRVACTKGPYWEELKSWGLNMVPLKIARSINPVSHVLSCIRLHRYLKHEKIDILHVHTPVAALLGRIVARIAKIPKVIYTAHGFYFHDNMPRWKYNVHVALEKFAARFHSYLFCVSEEDARTAERLKIDVPSRIFVIRNGVDRGRFNPEFHPRARVEKREEFKIPADARVVTIMGRMTREKGFFEFLEAAKQILKQVPETHFLAIGDTLASERDRIKRKLTEIANSPELQGRVHFAGFRDDIPELLAASDIFCLPSYREGLPVSIIEAMMMGLPVVASRIRGCREEVADGSSGLLVSPRSSSELAGALVYLLKHPETARKMGAAGRRRAQDLYSMEQVLETQWGVYRRIIGEAR